MCLFLSLSVCLSGSLSVCLSVSLSLSQSTVSLSLSLSLSLSRSLARSLARSQVLHPLHKVRLESSFFLHIHRLFTNSLIPVISVHIMYVTISDNSFFPVAAHCLLTRRFNGRPWQRMKKVSTCHESQFSRLIDCLKMTRKMNRVCYLDFSECNITRTI